MRYRFLFFVLMMSVCTELSAAAQYAPVSHIPTNTEPNAIAYDPATHRAYVAGFEWTTGRAVLTEVDGAGRVVSGVIDTGIVAVDVAVNPVTHLVYVVGGPSLQVVDASTGAVATIPLDIFARFVAVNEATNRVYVEGLTLEGVPTITIIDGASNAAVSSLETDTDPVAIAVDPLANRVYLAGAQRNHDTPSLTRIDGATNSVLDRIETNTWAIAMAVNPTTSRVYITGYEPEAGTPKFTVVDAAGNIVNSIVTNVDPVDVAISPLHNRVFLAGYTNPETRVVAVFDGETDALGQEMEVDTDPFALLVDDGLNRFYVAGFQLFDSTPTLLIVEPPKDQEVFPFSGFLAPVDAPPVVNSVKAGAAVPVKFSLGGDRGLQIFAADHPSSQQTSCSGGGVDDIEETVSAGGSTLVYDATSDQYTYIWKSDKAWAGSCRELQVRFVDGQTHVAQFRFR
jgi:hypothetical protein